MLQPNVIAPDKKLGILTGECVVATKNGYESLHNAKGASFLLEKSHESGYIYYFNLNSNQFFSVAFFTLEYDLRVGVCTERE